MPEERYQVVLTYKAYIIVDAEDEEDALAYAADLVAVDAVDKDLVHSKAVLLDVYEEENHDTVTNTERAAGQACT